MNQDAKCRSLTGASSLFCNGFESLDELGGAQVQPALQLRPVLAQALETARAAASASG